MVGCVVIITTNRNSRFGGGTQQDSHELFRCLLDGMRTEESEVCTACVILGTL